MGHSGIVYTQHNATAGNRMPGESNTNEKAASRFIKDFYQNKSFRAALSNPRLRKTRCPRGISLLMRADSFLFKGMEASILWNTTCIKSW